MKQYKPWNVVRIDRKMKAMKTNPFFTQDTTKDGVNDKYIPTSSDVAKMNRDAAGKGATDFMIGMATNPLRGTTIISMYILVPDEKMGGFVKYTWDTKKKTTRYQSNIFKYDPATHQYLGLGNTGFMAKYGGFNSAPSDTWPQFPITQGMAGAEGKEAIYKNYGASMEMDDVDARKYMSKWPKGSWQSGDKPRGGKFAGSINSNYQMGGQY